MLIYAFWLVNSRVSWSFVNRPYTAGGVYTHIWFRPTWCARESVESGRLMATDVWLVGPVGLVLGSNGSFGDAWVSLLSLYGTAFYTHWVRGYRTLGMKSVADYGPRWRPPAKAPPLSWEQTMRETSFWETGGILADRTRAGRRVDATTTPPQGEDSGRDPLVIHPRPLTHIRFDAKLDAKLSRFSFLDETTLDTRRSSYEVTRRA